MQVLLWILAFVVAAESFQIRTNWLKKLFSTKTDPPKLLLVSFDGFRARYLRDHSLPAFESLIDEGLIVKTRPAFTTLTFPNHFTMTTGLKPENHGIIGNYMYDKFLVDNFKPGFVRVERSNCAKSIGNVMIDQPTASCCALDERWWSQNPRTLPIYIYNKIYSPDRNSDAINFVGTMSSYWGHRLDDVKPFNPSLEWEHAVNNITLMFLRRKNPINMGLVYTDEPDYTGHYFGPESPQMKVALAKVNSALEYLVTHLKRLDLWKDINLIITTDHGMTKIHKTGGLILDKYIDLSNIILVNGLTIAHLHTKTVQEAIEIKAKLSNIPNFGIYLREEVPAKYEFSRNIRIGDVVILPAKGYLIFDSENHMNSMTMQGGHGYDNDDEDMQGIFIAKGPALRRGATVENGIINLQDVYPLMTHILELPQRQTDGNFTHILPLLQADD